MKLCEKHMEKLRDALEVVGLAPLVSSSGYELSGRLTREMLDGPSVDTFDPLIGAYYSIMCNAIEAPGIQGCVLDPYDPCPLDYLDAVHKVMCEDETCQVTYDDWIDCAVADQVEAWKALKP